MIIPARAGFGRHDAGPVLAGRAFGRHSSGLLLVEVPDAVLDGILCFTTALDLDLEAESVMAWVLTAPSEVLTLKPESDTVLDTSDLDTSPNLGAEVEVCPDDR